MGLLLGTLLLVLPAFGPKGSPDALLKDYFTAPTDTARGAVARWVLADRTLTCSKLARAIRGLELWEPQHGGSWDRSIELATTPPRTKHTVFSVPPAYDPKRSWPLIIALHGMGQSAASMLQMTRGFLGGRAEAFLIAAPQDLGPMGLTEPEGVAAEPRELVIALRRLFHVDSDRVYLIGYSLGAHNAWLSAVMHPDYFAGIVPLATPMQVIGGELLWPMLLSNLRHCPVLFCWGELDNLDAAGNPSPQGGNTALNRRMRAVIEPLGLEHFEAVELAGVGHMGVAPPAKSLAALLEQKRRRMPRKIHQTFRLPEESRAYWISARSLLKEPLPAGRIETRTKPGEDPMAALGKVLTSRLGELGASCAGQTITIQPRNCKEITLLLSDELIDLDKPVTILRGKKKLFSGQIRRDQAVMLEEAGRTWDFERLYAARVMIPMGGKVRVNVMDSTP